MKFVFRLTVCFWGVCTGITVSPSCDNPKTLSDVPDTPKDVILFMGQSNCVGQAKLDDLKELDSNYLEPPKNMVASPERPKGSIKWLQWRPRIEKSDDDFGSPIGLFGAELGFGRSVAPMYKHDKFAIKKICVSSTSLAEDWLETYKYNDGKSLVSSAVEWMQMLNKSDGCGDGRCRVKAIMWIQGEEDATHPEMSETYEKNLHKLVRVLRLGAHDDELPIFILELPSTGWTARSFQTERTKEIREAQAAYVKSDDRAVLIPGLDLSSLQGKHYNAEMQMELGRRFAESFRDHFFLG